MVESHCTKPVCEPCADDEYQSEYNRDQKCLMQPYCDPNSFFKEPEPASKLQIRECVCMDGYHCSAEECSTCIAHKQCPEGTQIKSKGNPKTNTVCEACPSGTFSNVTSAEKCQPWTKCEGRNVAKEGDDKSDAVCGETNRQHVGIIAGVLGFGVLIAASAILAHVVKKGYLKQLCKQNHPQPLEEELRNENEAELLKIQEDLVHPVQPEPYSNIHFSENERIVAQEVGKDSNFPQQDSQSTHM
ncbi:tumor necrosis factor receptor superfamily member 5 isoform X2 [Amia ocellicauda]